MMGNEWIGVDLDGTLAVYDGPMDAFHIGSPVPAMVERVKRWLAEGLNVRVVTARVSTSVPVMIRNVVRQKIEQWTLVHIGKALEVTAEKDYAMLELWDDRAVSVESNTGRRLA